MFEKIEQYRKLSAIQGEIKATASNYGYAVLGEMPIEQRVVGNNSYISTLSVALKNNNTVIKCEFSFKYLWPLEIKVSVLLVETLYNLLKSTSDLYKKGKDAQGIVKEFWHLLSYSRIRVLPYRACFDGSGGGIDFVNSSNCVQSSYQRFSSVSLLYVKKMKNRQMIKECTGVFISLTENDQEKLIHVDKDVIIQSGLDYSFVSLLFENCCERCSSNTQECYFVGGRYMTQSEIEGTAVERVTDTIKIKEIVMTAITYIYYESHKYDD